jgi:arsenate reductase
VTNVLFVCVQNAGRSQIAEALFRRAAEGRHDARSAGSRPAERVHEPVVEVLAESGIDVVDRVPRGLATEDVEWADVVVTMGCGDECPVTGKPTEDWELPDVRGASPEGVEKIAEEIDRRMAGLLEELGPEA